MVLQNGQSFLQTRSIFNNDSTCFFLHLTFKNVKKMNTPRDRRYATLDDRRTRFKVVTKFHLNCKALAKHMTKTLLSFDENLQAFKNEIIVQMYDVCAYDLGRIFYMCDATIDSFKLSERGVRLQLTDIGTRENPVDIVHLVSLFKKCIKIMDRSRRLLQTTDKCKEFAVYFKDWTKSLAPWAHASRRNRFIAVSRRKSQQASAGVESYEFEVPSW